MRSTLAGLLLLLATQLSAGTIHSIDPRAIPAYSGEHFVRISGEDLGDLVIFSGPAGHFEVVASEVTPTSVTAWIPIEVIDAPGSYAVIVRGPNGDSGPVGLEIYGDLNHPLVLLPTDPIVLEAESPRGTVVTYEKLAYGGRDPESTTVTCDPPSGSLFPLGPSHVTCTARNALGETASGGVYIYIYDGSAPVLTLPDRIVVPAEDESGAVVTYEASANDAIDGPLPVTCAPQSGSRFPVGTTRVECSATDSSLNPAYGSFDVVVTEGGGEPGTLVIHVPADITVEATGAGGATVQFEVTASGSSDPNPQISCDPVSGFTFPIGTTRVLCSATDSFGQRAEGEFDVTVTDTTAPVLTLPANIRTQATSSAGAEVTYTATATDVVDGEVPVTCTPPSGSTFPIGTTTVQCSASDARGNTANGSFTVEVYENAPPPVFMIHVPDDITAEATSSDGAVVTFEVTTSGGSDPNPQITCDPASGSTFPIGTTRVRCSATDSSGARAEGEFDVTVGDATAPHISSVSASPNVLSPANHKLVGVTVTVEAMDAVDPAPQCSVVDVTANEPILGAGSGNTDFDWRITAPLTVELRAERSGEGTDRVYTVHVVCSDASGNDAPGSVNVTVPKSASSDDKALVSPTPTKRRSVGKGRG